MLRGGGTENRRRRIARPDIERLNRAKLQRVSCMAFFEAALMHGRVLNDFLTARPNAKRYPEDVWAGDYITGWKAPNPGLLKRAEAVGSNRAIKDAIDKQLAHLSIRRVRGQRRFDIDGIVDAIVHDMKTFAEDERTCVTRSFRECATCSTASRGRQKASSSNGSSPP